MTLERISPDPVRERLTTAAEVSSHVVSMPSTRSSPDLWSSPTVPPFLRAVPAAPQRRSIHFDSNAHSTHP
jgi:hypothetical protein